MFCRVGHFTQEKKGEKVEKEEREKERRREGERCSKVKLGV